MWAPRMWAPHYWPKVGAESTPAVHRQTRATLTRVMMARATLTRARFARASLRRL